MPVMPLQIQSLGAVSGGADFSSLADLGKIYRESQNRTKLSDLGKGLADGSIDFRTAAGQVADLGDINATYRFLQLAESRKKQDDELAAHREFTSGLGQIFQPGGAPAPAPAAPTISPSAAPVDVPPASPPSVLPRAPVASTSKVYGDQEAEDAGLYEPTAKPVSPFAQPASSPQLSLTNLGGISQPTAAVPPPVRTAQANPSRAGVPSDVPNPQPVAATPTQQPSLANNFQGLNASHIPALIQASGNPRLPSSDRELAGKLLGRALDDTKTNEKIQMLQQLKKESGYAGTILQLETELRRASKAESTVNIDQKNETEEAKASGKAAGERRAALFASAGAASKTLQNLSRTEVLLNQVAQGKLEPSKLTISAWAKAFGLNDEIAKSIGLDPAGVGSAQALQSLTNESVIGKIGPGGFPANNFSDADREFITAIYPRLGDDPVANKIRIEGARRIANLDIQRARDYQTWRKEGGNKGKGFEDFELEWSEKISKQDLFGDLRKQSEAITGPARTDIGGTLNNPGRAPDAGGAGWQDLGGGVRIRERR